MFDFVIEFSPIMLSVAAGLFIADQIRKNDKWWGLFMLIAAIVIEALN